MCSDTKYKYEYSNTTSPPQSDHAYTVSKTYIYTRNQVFQLGSSLLGGCFSLLVWHSGQSWILASSFVMISGLNPIGSVAVHGEEAKVVQGAGTQS